MRELAEVPPRGPSVLARLVKVEPGEGWAVLWSTLYFFCLMFGYYVIRPLRDEMGSAGSDEDLFWLYMGTLAGTLLLSPIFSALVSRYARRVFVPWSYHMLSLNLVVFFLLFRHFGHGQARQGLGFAFFLWGSIFNLFAVSVYWGFMADLFRSDQARRLFGFMALGGTLGAVAGSKFTAQLAATLGVTNLLLVAALMLEACVLCILRLVRLFDGRPGEHPTEEPPGQGALSGISRVLASPYLLSICVFMFLYTLTSTLVYFEQARIIRATGASHEVRTAFFAQIDYYVNLVTALTQFFLTARIIGFLGVGATMASLPVVTLLAYSWLALAPGLEALILLQTLRRSTEYALEKPCREMLFTVLPRGEKYCAKNFIDTFVYRGGDVLGAGADRWLKLLAMDARALSLVMLPLTAFWVYLAFYLGRRRRELAAALPEPAPEPPSAVEGPPGP